eukprot:CAMPEP_0170147870 /NCGR_PEP_ID=MMETSP0033_2-20121228/36239_1 /TAXON_ID=195969 /ORGANISM="Dolichomastix tenuilepis, Strain CCMP3274" /LENGTH=97 /DNA_ID=CAMNT_0010384719 /DNA_START=1 /DNA_END=294 /DNA_ORIENTATION=+
MDDDSAGGAAGGAGSGGGAGGATGPIADVSLHILLICSASLRASAANSGVCSCIPAKFASYNLLPRAMDSTPVHSLGFVQAASTGTAINLSGFLSYA